MGIGMAIVSVCLPGVVQHAYAGGCKEPTAEKRAELVRYVVKRFRAGAENQVILVESAAANDSCFWKMKYEIGAVRKDITLYLSPDGNYLTPDVYDLKADPLAEERASQHEVQEAVLVGRPPSKGPATAPVEVVEFSDFECPYCKRMTDVLEKEVLPAEGAKVRLVFQSFPLPMHPWAKQAAQMAECAQLQNPDAFWKVHDFLFQNQSTITNDNLRAKVDAAIAGDASLNKAAFESCVDQDLAVGPVQKSYATGQKYGVRATPTIFINGARFEGLRSASQIQTLIEAAARGEVLDSALVSTSGDPARPSPTSQCTPPTAARQTGAAQ
jgi:protein-disulfide isomerase